MPILSQNIYICELQKGGLVCCEALTSSGVVEPRFEPILSSSKAIILTTVLCCFPVGLWFSNILSVIFHKTSEAELLRVKQRGNPGIGHFASSTSQVGPWCSHRTPGCMKWQRKPLLPRTRHNRDRAKPTVPHLHSLWVKISSLSMEQEAQEHDSQLKQQA